VILAANWNAKSADDQQSVSKLSKRIFKEDPFGFLLQILSAIKIRSRVGEKALGEDLMNVYS
jgi:hypothetical protein